MATAKIGAIGDQLDLTIKQGSTFICNVQMNNPDTTAVDLTSCAIRGQIRKNALDADPAVAVFDVTIIDAVAGEFSFGLTDEVTMAISADESIAKPGSKYVWDMELEDSLGNVLPIFYGIVTVFREVTR